MKRRSLLKPIKVAKKQRVMIKDFGDLAAIFESIKSKESFLGWGITLPAMHGQKTPTLRYVELKRLRLKALNQCIVETGKAFEEGKLSQEGLETVLNYLYAELNKRVNKTEKKLDA